MSVFTRFGDIINANVNALLEQAEDPAKMVRMITQEMEETLVEVRSASARNLADRKQVTAKSNWHMTESETWEQKAELAINRGRDDLAKAALREKSRHDEAIAALVGEAAALDTAIDRLKQDTLALEEKLKAARIRQKTLVMRGNTAKQRIKIKRQIHDVSHDAAFERFEAYERKLDEMEGEIESYDLASRSLSTEIDDLAVNEKMDAELAALKSRVQQQSNNVV